jgi:hypothetical protein
MVAREAPGIVPLLVAIAILVQRRHAVDVHVIGHRQGDLLEVVGALGAAGGLARRLDGRQQEGDQDGDDGDHDQQLDQGEAAMSAHDVSVHWVFPGLPGRLISRWRPTHARSHGRGHPDAGASLAPAQWWVRISMVCPEIGNVARNSMRYR